MNNDVCVNNSLLVFTIHRVHQWWSDVASNMGFEFSATVTDQRGEADFDLSEDFYFNYSKRLNGEGAFIFTDDEIDDIIMRCRLLRWLPKLQARAMILAMADSQRIVLDAVNPSVIVSFPMDRYVSDVLSRLASAKGIPFYELTASPVPGMSMVMSRGKLVTTSALHDPVFIETIRREIADPLFVPSYVQSAKVFTKFRWLKIFLYFRLRGLFFRFYSLLKRDPLSSHYMDSQSFLGHKPKLKDIIVCDMVNPDWKKCLESFPIDKRVFIGLQLFPEASIDYWVEDKSLVAYEDLLVSVAEIFTKAGYFVAIKDHPLQFGFRRHDLLDRLLSIKNTVLVPYEVNGNEVLDSCGINFTCTGTLGLQAALTGKVSIATPCYYTNADDFVLFSSRTEVESLPERVAQFNSKANLHERQSRIVNHLLSGSFAGDFFSFKDYDPACRNSKVADLGKRFGNFINELQKDGN